MTDVFIGSTRIGSLLKLIAASKPWYAYALDGRGENFKSRKEAVAWLKDQYQGALND
ncbi:hypothetical protein JEY40_24545 [Bradyrhizobium japonicum]|uniref:hypothetical protein n=1 Tax=Bradyrhizobium japonicum TaxID=375 RepID=UPI00200E467A|nr:hypothetical protein [Bradyrhizobium japonicum]UQD69188.1 hypothetical protein JEY40_24545 [Bradyrhizobium japonicum]WAX24450.1 hypothetical protein [Bradyrhizobium phage ppBjS10J-1]